MQTDLEQEQQQKKRKNNRITGIILLGLGIIGLITRFFAGNNDVWRTVDILKLAVSVFMIGYGAYTLYKNKR
jgi:hypothetical protein